MRKSSSLTFLKATNSDGQSHVGVDRSDALTVHVEMLVDLCVRCNVLLVNAIDKGSLCNDQRAIGREEMICYAAPRSLLCALVRVSEGMSSVVMRILLHKANMKSHEASRVSPSNSRPSAISEETSIDIGAGESKIADQDRIRYHPDIVPIVGMLIGAHEPLLGSHQSWIQTAADTLLYLVKLLDSNSFYSLSLIHI